MRILRARGLATQSAEVSLPVSLHDVTMFGMMERVFSEVVTSYMNALSSPVFFYMHAC